MATPEQPLDKIVVQYNHEHQVINLKEVLFIQAISSVVKLHLAEGASFLSSQSLKFYEEILPKDSFLKTHKSYIINTLKVKSVSQGRGGEVILTSGHKVPIATIRKPIFLKFLKS